MTQQKRVRLQLDIPPEIRNRIKAVAYGRGQSIVEFYLLALKKAGDEELNQLIDKELEERPVKGRPTN